MNRIDEKSHRVSRDNLLLRTFEPQRDDCMRDSLDHPASENLHRFTNLDDQTVLGHRYLYDLPILGLGMETNSRVRPGDLLSLGISVESRC